MDLEWEDAGNGDWDVLLQDDDVVEEANGVHIEVTIEDATKKPVRHVVVTKEHRLRCLALHRAHMLCLLARATALDQAACSEEVQACILSLLPDQRLILRNGDAAEAPQRTLLTLTALLDWFRTAFSAMADVGPDDDDRGASAPWLREQLTAALRLRAGSAELLVALFVALVRAQGLPARYVRLMDAMPIEPWRKRAAAGAMRALSPEEARAKEAVHARKKRQQQQQQQQQQDDDDADKGQDDDDAEEITGSVAAGSRSSNPAEKKRVRHEGACGGKGSSKAKETTDPSSAAGKGSSKAKEPTDPSSAAGKGSSKAKEPTDPSSAAGTSRNRGDDEFERQMQLAMMATAAEAEARLTKAAASAPRKGAPPGTSLAKTKAALFGVRGRAGGGASKASSSSSALPGLVAGTRAGLAPTAWAEVYCGSAEAGRWIHVDVINGLVNKPETVETATQRSSPIAYVVALQGPEGGEARDVTSRYVGSALGLQKLRDERWWAATLRAHASARVTRQRGGGRGAGDWPSAAVTAAAGPAGPSGGGESSPWAVTAGSAGGALPAASRAGRGGKIAADVRAKREDEELQRRSASQMLGLPTSLEGFKTHPLYILKRHLTKYQGLPEDDEDLEEDLEEEPAAEAAGPTAKLYGEWQTGPWRRPVAADGIVPKNEFGNVECPPLLKELPVGTVHLEEYPGIWVVCKSLNVDYAPALVGFELQAGRMLPKIQGVVVCEEFEHQVVAAYIERETARQEALSAQRLREARNMWARLIQAVRVRLQLRNSYEEEGPGGTADAPAGPQERQGAGGSGVIDLTAEDDAQAGEAATDVGGGPAAALVTQREKLSQRLQHEYRYTGGADGQQAQTGQGIIDKRDNEAGLDMEEF